MELLLSHNSPTNADLSTSDGRVLYSISTPRRLTGRTTTVSKYTLSHGGLWPTGGSQELARVHWHSWRSSQLVYNGQMLDFDSFLHKNSMLRGTRSFVGPDGRSYKWKTGWKSCHLETDDGHGATIAKFRHKSLLTGTKPALEIDASALHMLDLIVITWMYFEKKRRDQEAATVVAAAS